MTDANKKTWVVKIEGNPDKYEAPVPDSESERYRSSIRRGLADMEHGKAWAHPIFRYGLKRGGARRVAEMTALLRKRNLALRGRPAWADKSKGAANRRLEILKSALEKFIADPANARYLRPNKILKHELFCWWGNYSDEKNPFPNESTFNRRMDWACKRVPKPR